MKLQLTIATLILASLCGCKNEDEAANTGTDAADKTKAAAGPAISVETKNADELNELIASHKGKIVVVDLWTRASEPCLAELPQLLALQQKYSKDLVAISLNVDHTEDNEADEAARKKVLAKLTELKMTTINVMSSETRSDVLGEQGLFAIPAAIIYDREGEFHKCFDGEDLSFEWQIFPLIEEMLAVTKDAESGSPSGDTSDKDDGSNETPKDE